MCKHTGRPTNGTVPIIFGTYNFRNWRNSGLEAALQGMSQANMDLGIFQETKLTDGICTHGSDGYRVVATDVPSQHCGGVTIFHWPAPHFAVEAVQQFGPNIIRFQLATGARRRYIVGCYLSHNDTLMIERVVEAPRELPKGAELLVAGDLNINFAAPEGDRREEDIAATFATEGLEDMVPHFLPLQCRWCRDSRTWGMLRKGREVRSRTDFILWTYRRLFGNVSVRDPWHTTYYVSDRKSVV